MGGNSASKARVVPEIDAGKIEELKNSNVTLLNEIIDNKNKNNKIVNEMTGIQADSNSVKATVDDLMNRKKLLNNERIVMMKYCWEHDADTIFRFVRHIDLDVTPIVRLLITRSKWQLNVISSIYSSKYIPIGFKTQQSKSPRSPRKGTANSLAPNDRKSSILSTAIIDGLKVAIGSSNPIDVSLYKLFENRIMDPIERDGALLNLYSAGSNWMEREIIEILCTRNNEELQEILTTFLANYGKSFIDITKKKCNNANLKEFLLKVLECQRDETRTPLEDEIAEAKAAQLYEAGAARMMGYDASHFTRILATINPTHFLSVSQHYKGLLKQDIISKVGSGEFLLAILGRIEDKFVFLASILATAFSGNNRQYCIDCIVRILGCLSHQQCQKLATAYNNGNYGKPFLEALRSKISEGPLLMAITELVVADPSHNPMGSYRAAGTDESEAKAAGEAANQSAKEIYKASIMVQKGEKEIAEGRGKEMLPKLVTTDFPDVAAVTTNLTGRQLQEVNKKLLAQKAELTKAVEVSIKEKNKSKRKYLSDISQQAEDTVWIRILVDHIASLKVYISSCDAQDLARAVAPSNGVVVVDERALVRILCRRNRKMIRSCATTFQSTYGKSFLSVLQKHTSDHPLLYTFLYHILLSSLPPEESSSSTGSTGNSSTGNTGIGERSKVSSSSSSSSNGGAIRVDMELLQAAFQMYSSDITTVEHRQSIRIMIDIFCTRTIEELTDLKRCWQESTRSTLESRLADIFKEGDSGGAISVLFLYCLTSTSTRLEREGLPTTTPPTTTTTSPAATTITITTTTTTTTTGNLGMEELVIKLHQARTALQSEFATTTTYNRIRNVLKMYLDLLGSLSFGQLTAVVQQYNSTHKGLMLELAIQQDLGGTMEGRLACEGLFARLGVRHQYCVKALHRCLTNKEEKEATTATTSTATTTATTPTTPTATLSTISRIFSRSSRKLTRLIIQCYSHYYKRNLFSDVKGVMHSHPLFAAAIESFVFEDDTQDLEDRRLPVLPGFVGAKRPCLVDGSTTTPPTATSTADNGDLDKLVLGLQYWGLSDYNKIDIQVVAPDSVKEVPLSATSAPPTVLSSPSATGVSTTAATAPASLVFPITPSSIATVPPEPVVVLHPSEAFLPSQTAVAATATIMKTSS